MARPRKFTISNGVPVGIRPMATSIVLDVELIETLDRRAQEFDCSRSELIQHWLRHCAGLTPIVGGVRTIVNTPEALNLQTQARQSAPKSFLSRRRDPSQRPPEFSDKAVFNPTLARWENPPGPGVQWNEQTLQWERRSAKRKDFQPPKR